MNKLIFDLNEKIRLDVFLTEKLNISRSRISKAIKKGDVKVNDNLTSPSLILKEGDVITFDIKEDVTEIKPSYDEKIEYLYKDDEIAIINKRRGLVVHPAAGHFSDSLVNLLLADEDFKYDDTSSLRPGIVHRIDKDTQGLLLVSLNPNNMDFLSKCIKDHLFEREYLALVNGKVKDEYFQIDAPLTRPNHTNKKATVDIYNGNDAITHCHLLSTTGKVSLISCKLETGRTHQIRAHLAYIKHPLVGDSLYNSIKDDRLNQGQVLSAIRLTIIHPKTLKKMTFTAPIDDYFKKALNLYYK